MQDTLLTVVPSRWRISLILPLEIFLVAKQTLELRKWKIAKHLQTVAMAIFKRLNIVSCDFRSCCCPQFLLLAQTLKPLGWMVSISFIVGAICSGLLVL